MDVNAIVDRLNALIVAHPRDELALSAAIRALHDMSSELSVAGLNNRLTPAMWHDHEPQLPLPEPTRP